MTKSSDIISSKIVIILIFISSTTIFGCKWGSWSFDLFGGDSINGDSDNDNGDGIPVEFPPAVCSANIGGTKINEHVERVT